jgi:hypothetical protein
VEDILKKQTFLQEAIGQGIVSFNKLAEHIKPEIEKAIGKKPKHASVAMALRRYAEKLELKQNKIEFSFFKETLLKTDICLIIIEESQASLDRLQSIYNSMDLKHGNIFNIVHANYEIGIITNQSSKDKVLDAFSDFRVIRVVDHLVIISLTYTKDYIFTPGIIYNVTRFLAWENINIYNIWLTTQELNLLISKEDAMRTYNILEKLVNSTNAKKS